MLTVQQPNFVVGGLASIRMGPIVTRAELPVRIPVVLPVIPEHAWIQLQIQIIVAAVGLTVLLTMAQAGLRGIIVLVQTVIVQVMPPALVLKFVLAEIVLRPAAGLMWMRVQRVVAAM